MEKQLIGKYWPKQSGEAIVISNKKDIWIRMDKVTT